MNKNNTWHQMMAFGAPMVLPEVLNDVEAKQNRRSVQDVVRSYFD